MTERSKPRRLVAGESSYSWHDTCGCMFYENAKGTRARWWCRTHGRNASKDPAAWWDDDYQVWRVETMGKTA